MGGVARWILDLLYPPRCPGCQASESRGGFCPACLDRVPAPASPLCPACGIPFRTAVGADHLCGRCLRKPPAYRRARACSLYSTSGSDPSPLANALHRYKYGRDVTLAPVLAHLVSRRCSHMPEYDLMIPVPLHSSRLRWRGFNQSLHLANHLAATWRMPVDPFVLRRCRSTPPQVGLDERARRRNVRGAFTVADKASVKGRAVLLVDDVFTTGATVNECAATLRRAGARCVDVVVLARVLPH